MIARPSRLLSMLILLGGAFRIVVPTSAAEPHLSLVEKQLTKLSDSSVSALGQQALAIREKDWKHGETDHFIYHYFTPLIGEPAAVESEFFYSAIAQELKKDTTQWERKGQIYIFEEDADWDLFKSTSAVEKWSGGVHSGGDIFLRREPMLGNVTPGPGLAHELTHLIVFRFFGAGIPLWLNEGLAENTASHWYSTFWRMRGYSSRPRSYAVKEESYLPLSALTSAAAYPVDAEHVLPFYFESERLVRFLSIADRPGFLEFLDSMARGKRFDTSIEKGFGRKFFNVDALEKAFKPYATDENPREPN